MLIATDGDEGYLAMTGAVETAYEVLDVDYGINED
jgi:hypothetical protein